MTDPLPEIPSPHFNAEGIFVMAADDMQKQLNDTKEYLVDLNETLRQAKADHGLEKKIRKLEFQLKVKKFDEAKQVYADAEREAKRILSEEKRAFQIEEINMEKDLELSNRMIHAQQKEIKASIRKNEETVVVLEAKLRNKSP